MISKALWWKAFSRHPLDSSLFCVSLCTLLSLHIRLSTPWDRSQVFSSRIHSLPGGYTHLVLTDLRRLRCGKPERHLHCGDGTRRVSPPCGHPVRLNHTIMSLRHDCFSERSKNKLFKIQGGISEKQRVGEGSSCGNINSRQPRMEREFWRRKTRSPRPQSH